MRLIHLDLGRHWRGGQRQCALLCRRLAAGGCEVHLIGRRDGALLAELRGGPIVRHALMLPGGINPLSALEVAAILRARHPDLIAAHEAHGLGLAAVGRRLAGLAVPLVYHRRVDVPPRSGWGSRWKLRQTDCFICVSHAAAAVLRAAGIAAERIRVVHSGVPPLVRIAGARQQVVAELGIPPAARLVGTIAGLITHKGHAILLEAVAEIAPAAEAVHLLLIGSGPLRDALERKASQLGIGECVHFLGERRDIARLLSALDLFVLPSLTEGLGSSILDAFSLEVPVVATRAGGIPELVADGRTGRLVAPGDAAELAGAMRAAWSDPSAAARMTARAAECFRAHFTDDAMATATSAVYRELLLGGGA